MPKEFEFEGVSEVEITKDGESLILTPKRKTWISLASVAKADSDFLLERRELLEEDRVEF